MILTPDTPEHVYPNISTFFDLEVSGAGVVRFIYTPPKGTAYELGHYDLCACGSKQLSFTFPLAGGDLSCGLVEGTGKAVSLLKLHGG